MKIYGLYQKLPDLTNAKNGQASTTNTVIDGSNNENQAIDDDATKKFSVTANTLDVIYKFNDYAHVTAYSLANAAAWASDTAFIKWFNPLRFNAEIWI